MKSKVPTAAVAMCFIAAAAYPHEWYSGQKNEKGNSCCGGEDCGAVAPIDVDMLTPTHWRIKVRPGTIGTWGPEEAGAVVLDFYGNPGMSPDDQYHACATRTGILEGLALCLFVGGIY